MNKIILAFLPLLALGQAIQTKPYDDLKTGDNVVTGVTFSAISAPVQSVNGQTGDVVVTAASIGAITNESNVSGFTFTNGASKSWQRAGNIRWDVDEHSPVADTDTIGTSLTWGGEISTYSRNNESFTLSNGVPVYIVSGAPGPVKRVGLASCMDVSREEFFGLVTVDAGIPQNGYGFVTSFGRVKGVDTSKWEEGDILWLCADGGMTNSMPVTTNSIWQVGRVEYKHENHGVIFVAPQKNGYARMYQLNDHMTNNSAHASLFSQKIDAPTGTNIAQAVIAPYTNSIATAWQNPSYVASDFIITVNGREAEVTQYIGGGGVVEIPCYYNGARVTSIGADAFRDNNSVVSVYADYIKNVKENAFNGCTEMQSISMNSCTNIGDFAFYFCPLINFVEIKNVLRLGDTCFGLPEGATAIYLSMYYYNNQPQPSGTSFTGRAIDSVTNFIENATSTGWGSTFESMPVVRKPVSAGTVISIGAVEAGGRLTGKELYAGGMFVTNAIGTRNEIVVSPTNNANLLRIELEPGANVTGAFVGRPGAVVPPGANGSYMCYIKAPASGTYNHALGLEAGKSDGEILHLYNKDQKHVARFNTANTEELEVRWSRPDGGNQFHWVGGLDPYLIIGTNNPTRTASSRLTVKGNVDAESYTVNGAALSSAPLAWTPILTGAGATVCTANVTTARSIFYFESSEAVSFTNNLSALPVNCGTNNQWTIVFNATRTNALTSTNWLGNYEFVGFTPEMTVTGRYEYACETSCGTKIRVKQIYPTVYPWTAPLIGAGPASSAFYNLWNNVTGALTNHIRMYIPFDAGEVLLVRHPVAFTASTADTAIRYETTDYNNGSIVVVSNIGTNSYAANTVYVNSLVVTNSGANSLAYATTTQRILRFSYEKAGVSVMSVGQPKMKKINELEQLAFDAGWRP